MYEEMQQRVEAYASLILRRYFCESDVEFLISTFDDDIVWLGAGPQQKAEGRGQRGCGSLLSGRKGGSGTLPYVRRAVCDQGTHGGIFFL